MSEGRVSCISHPPRERYTILRPAYVELCDGNVCAALLVSVLEFWTNVRLSNAEERDGDLWVYRTREELSDDLCGAFGKDAIRGAIVQLEEQGIIERRRNPQKGWDRTWQYRLAVDRVQAANRMDAHSRDSDLGLPDAPTDGMNSDSREPALASSDARPCKVGDSLPLQGENQPSEAGETGMNTHSRKPDDAKSDTRPSKVGNPPSNTEEPEKRTHTQDRERASSAGVGKLAAELTSILGDVADAKGRARPTTAELVAIAARYPDVDQAAEAHRFAAHFTAGDGASHRPSSISARWSAWLERTATSPPAPARRPKAEPFHRSASDRSRREAQHEADLEWARAELPDLDPEAVADCYRIQSDRAAAGRMDEPTAESVRARLEQLGRDREIAA